MPKTLQSNEGITSRSNFFYNFFQISARIVDSFSVDYPAFAFSLKQEVEVTESYIPEFSISTFLAGLGGSLGLWLGVGAVQLIGVGVGILDWV